jgi:glycosyltransferase involved in cell wall biosynthesis
MKVMLVTVDTAGGMLHYASQLANALARKLDVVVIAPVGADRRHFNDNVRIIQMPMGDVRRNLYVNTLIISRPIKFLKTIINENPDIIHCTYGSPWLALLFLLFNKYPVITTIHDAHPHIGAFKLKELAITKMHIRFSDAIIVHGSRAQQDLGEGVKSFIIPHGDYSFFLKYKKLDIAEEEDTILFFGRIEDYKGLGYLISAVNQLSVSVPDIKLIIAGKGDLSKYQSLIMEKDHFEICNGYIPDDQVPLLFQRAGIVVLPYIEATQSGVVPVASAFKKPVIVTDVGDIPEAVEDGVTGIIVPPRNISALAAAIRSLLGNKTLRREMGEQAYKKMVKDLSWDDIAVKTIAVYQRALDVRRKERIDAL